MNLNTQIADLMKALEAGQYNAAPSTLTQGSALQMEDLSPVLEKVTFDDSHLILQKSMKIQSVKSTLHQFNRQLDYGVFGGSAQYEGGIGEEETSNYVRAVVPMCYYSTTRRVTVAATHVQTFNGVKMEDASSEDAAMKLAGDIEFDIFRGQADFSNAGIFDGNPLAIASIPNMRGIDSQIRESDALSNTQDLMLAEYGSDQSIVIPVNGILKQADIDDAAVRSNMNLGKANKLMLDPISLAQYNKLAHARERIVLAGSAQSASGADLRTQWTTSGSVSLVPSRFLAGKTRPARARFGSPAAPSFASASPVNAASNLEAGDYVYYVTAVSERGESVPSAAATVSVAQGDSAVLTINAVAQAKYYNVYRSQVGGNAADCKFIGKVKDSGLATSVFTDLGNRAPGSISAYLIQEDTMDLAELAPFSSMQLAVTDLSLPKAYYRFLSTAVRQPRKNTILENVVSQL
jgi:hypothetical protein